jgi:hypothetical protein
MRAIDVRAVGKLGVAKVLNTAFIMFVKNSPLENCYCSRNTIQTQKRHCATNAMSVAIKANFDLMICIMVQAVGIVA